MEAIMISIPDVDFDPWLIATEPDGDLAIRDDAPDEIKQAWQKIQDQLEEMYATALTLD